MNHKIETNVSVINSNVNKENVKSKYFHSIKESTIRDLKPILFICRLFGVAPYTISSTSISKSQTGVIYSGVIVIYYLCVISARLKVVYSQNIDVKLKILTLARITFLVLTICADAILCIHWDQKFQNCLENIWSYEKVFKSDKKGSNLIVVISWTLSIVTMSFYLFMAIMSYLYDNDRGLVALIDITIFPAITFSILKFLLFVIVIRKMFRNLNLNLTEDSSAGEKVNVKKSNFQELCLLHDQLASAMDDLNSLYSIPMLLWISAITFNILSRNYQLFIIKTIRYFYNDLREILFLIYYILILTALTIICQITAKEANKISSIMFSPKCYQRHAQNMKNDISNVGYYFHNYSFKFTAAFGLFAVDLQLLLTIAGAVTTYFVILLH
ncbi:uncharacterized protein LOC122506531 [Leptopilina heterotoma]|uniref:uncharacterized protein LOC122506531 n=1 Tax=Leptopilina heterotoma TaxID=63436 RepID=UPI001CA8133E|nr:uncharacterized protein LOC122506531 [Leptopilina heterotoma]